MATLRALEGPEPLERFVELTKMIRALETERDALKDTITEALQHEPPSGSNGEQYVDFDGLRVELCHRARWTYSGAVKDAEEHVRDLKLRERANGNAELQGHTAYTKCTVIRSRSETEARERKASAIASTLAAGSLSAPEVETWPSPSETPSRSVQASVALQRRRGGSCCRSWERRRSLPEMKWGGRCYQHLLPLQPPNQPVKASLGGHRMSTDTPPCFIWRPSSQRGLCERPRRRGREPRFHHRRTWQRSFATTSRID